MESVQTKLDAREDNADHEYQELLHLKVRQSRGSNSGFNEQRVIFAPFSG